MIEAIIFAGIFIGGLSVLGMIHLFARMEHRLTVLWCNPGLGKKGLGFRRRVKMALASNPLTALFPWFLGLLHPVYLLFLADGVAPWFASSIFGGYVGFSVVAYPFGLGKKLREFREQMAIYAAGKMVKLTETSFSEPILLAAAQSTEMALRLAATQGLRELGTPAGMKALGKLCGDRNPRVSVEAMKAYGVLLKVLKGGELKPIAPLAGLIADYEREKAQRKYREDWDDPRQFPQFHALSQAIHKIVYSQLLLRQAWPDVFCARCHVFAKIHQHLDWRWLSCPICQEGVDLKPGIRQVIGTIGAATEWVLSDGVLRVGLWDRSGKRAVYAELASMEIIAGSDLDYDWAVTAAVECLRNQHPTFKQGVPCRLIGSPPLSANSLRILGTLTGPHPLLHD